MKQLASQHTQQTQKLTLSTRMQQALKVLQLPVLELSSAIREEVERNPILDLEEERNQIFSFKDSRQLSHKIGKIASEQLLDPGSIIEKTTAYEPSLFEDLMSQVREHFALSQDQKKAEWLIGNLDEHGLLTSPIEEIALLGGYQPEELTPILKIIQKFEPIGIGSRHYQELFLLQLNAAGKQNSVAFHIIQNYFHDLLNNRIRFIAKKLSLPITDIKQIILKDIATLRLRPVSIKAFNHNSFVPHITPDITILYDAQGFSIEVNQHPLPALHLNKTYIDLLKNPTLSTQAHNYINNRLSSGKWLIRILKERNVLLYNIALELIRRQTAFLLSEQQDLAPMTMRELSEALGLHESTITRAVANKYVSFPSGQLFLRSFFTNRYLRRDGKYISSQTVKRILKQLIDQENKENPLTDQKLSEIIKAKGLPCSRRTISKYRKSLSMQSSTTRKLYSY